MDEGYSRTKNFTAPSPRITLDELEGPSLRDHEANDGWMVCMEGERKVILSALTSVGYIRYYIVSVYQVYGVQRSYLREREEKKFFFFFIKRSTHDGEHVCTCVCVCVWVWAYDGLTMVNIDFIENYCRRKWCSSKGMRPLVLFRRDGIGK